MKDLNEYISEHLVTESRFRDKQAAISFLDENGYDYSIEEDKVDHSERIIVNTPTKGVTAVFEFISNWEYLYSIEKDGNVVMWLQTSSNLDAPEAVEAFTRRLNPASWLATRIDDFKDSLKRAKKGKRVDYSRVYNLESKIARYENYLKKIK